MNSYHSFLLIPLILLSYLLQANPHTTDVLPTYVPINISNSTQVCVNSIGLESSLLILVPAVLLGSNYALLKRYNKGDGVFFQWVVCVGVWICGFIVSLVQSQTQFYMFGMIGGIIWSGGNFLLVSLIQLVGFTTGVLVWSLVFMGSGWGTGMLDLLGVPHDKLCVPFFNYGGVVMCLSGVILLAFLKDNRSISIQRSDSVYNDLHSILAPDNASHYKEVRYQPGWAAVLFVRRLSPLKKKVLGYALAILMGIAWGTHFLPMQILLVLAEQDSYYSARPLDYIFPYATGVLLISTLYTCLYSLYMRNRPTILPQSILPALAVGALSGGAISLWAHLNQRMSPAVTFPIIATGTPTIGFVTSIIAYRGWKNVFIFSVTFFVILFGIILVLLSKVHPFAFFTHFPYDNIVV